jgi:hypothetical protein
MLRRLRDVFKSFQSHDVKYVVIGGIAAVLHGVPRATFDLDILIEPTRENAEKLLKALLAANVATASLISPENLLANEITVFNDRVRIDVQTFSPGIEFEEAWKNHLAMEYQGQALCVVSLRDLIASKRASGREIDLEDIRLLSSGEEGAKNS